MTGLTKISIRMLFYKSYVFIIFIVTGEKIIMTQLDIALMYSRNRTSNHDLLEVETFLDESRVVLTSFYIQFIYN